MTDFDAVFALIQLLADPAAAKARMAELVATMDGAATREAEANAAHAALEAERSRLTKLGEALREREVTVRIAESKIAGDLEELQKWRRESRESRLITVGPGGLTRERDTTPVAPDPISDPFAPSMKGETPVRRTSTRVRA
jgi:hypothetical protein